MDTLDGARVRTVAAGHLLVPGAIGDGFDDGMTTILPPFNMGMGQYLLIPFVSGMNIHLPAILM